MTISKYTTLSFFSINLHGQCGLNCYDKTSQNIRKAIVAGGNGVEDIPKEKYDCSKGIPGPQICAGSIRKFNKSSAKKRAYSHTI